MAHTYDYPRPMVTVDALVFVPRGSTLEVALIRRGQEPFAGKWALPGGFIDMNEELIDAARRELHEETGISAPWLREACASGTVGRDPRGRTISVVFYTLLPERPEAKAGDDAAEVEWFDVERLPPMAFDHGEVTRRTLARLNSDSLVSSVAFRALPEHFSANDFHHVCQAIPSLRTSIHSEHETLASLQERGLIKSATGNTVRVDWEMWGEPAPWF